MKKAFTFISILLVILFCSEITFPQNKDKAALKQIENYVNEIDRMLKTAKEPDLVFADVSQNNKPRWRKFASSGSLGKFREKSETYSISNNWLRDKKIVASVFTLFSDSGDWANYVYYYFRSDGTLAKIKQEYRTFHGDFAAIKNIYFNSKGKILKKNTKYLDLDNKLTELDQVDLKDNEPMMNDFGYYKSTGNLPFYHLLRVKK